MCGAHSATPFTLRDVALLILCCFYQVLNSYLDQFGLNLPALPGTSCWNNGIIVCVCELHPRSTQPLDFPAHEKHIVCLTGTFQLNTGQSELNSTSLLVSSEPTNSVAQNRKRFAKQHSINILSQLSICALYCDIKLIMTENTNLFYFCFPVSY